MSSILADVEFHSEKSCFAIFYCPILASYDSDELQYFEIGRSIENGGDQSICVVVVAGRIARNSSKSDGRSRLVINGVFGNCLKMKFGDQVLVSITKEPKPCYALVAEPVSPDDWEVVLHNAQKIEDQLLVQLRVVFVGLEFPIWIDGGYCMFLKIVSFDADGAPCGLLMEDTEVTVAPKLPIKNATKDAAKPSKPADSKSSEAKGQTEEPKELLLRGVKTFDAMLDKLERFIKMIISEDEPIFIGYPLIVGSSGTGKTTLAKAVCQELKARGEIASFSSVECKSLKGKAVESVEKRLRDKLSTIADSQPAVIVLDDLDSLCSSCSSMEEITPGVSMLYERISRVLADLINEIRHKRRRILFLATSSSLKSLNSYLIAARGVRYFDAIVEIGDLDLESRRSTIDRLVRYGMNETPSDSSSKSAISWLAKRSEGYVMADLVALIERTLVEFENRTETKESTLTIGDFKSALNGFIPIALSGVKKGVSDRSEMRIGFDGIGGLDEAKVVLEKVLMLPTKYPKIFATLPIRLPRGILVYGPSGCGKTLLAGAVARDYHLNFIQVKGAELLSKYIGASEQGVRDTFARAKSMKPCLVFFDEFDALAPRRGHDSTGVTDRVVNQLLTELDGVEGLEGVFVLAASSRPDLIDPALLRPGRIDKRVYCGVPNETERIDILRKVSQPLSIDPDIDFVTIAARTDHFSGADLKTVLLDAHFAALREATAELKRTENGDGRASEKIDQVRIMQRHIDLALDSIKPSITPDERRRFDRMYQNFQGDLDESSLIKHFQDTVGKRATLA